MSTNGVEGQIYKVNRNDEVTRIRKSDGEILALVTIGSKSGSESKGPLL